MTNSDYTDDQVTGWRRHTDKYLLLSRKTVLIIAAVFVLSVVLHKAMYGPFSDHFVPKDCLQNNSVGTILQDTDGNLWFGTGGGVSRYDGTSWQTFTTNDGLADKYVRCSLQDRNGNLWFGTRGGVSRYDGASWQTFTTKDGLAHNLVRAMLQDRDGNLWFASGMREGAGVSRYDGASWQTFTTNDGLADNRVWCSLQDRDGNLWFGTRGGLSRYDGASWQTLTKELRAMSCCSILQDTDGNLWFGAAGGVSRYDGASWQTFTTVVGPAGNEIRSSLQDRDGNLWFGTYQLLLRYDGTSWQTFTTKIGLVPNGVFILGTVLIPLYFLISLVYTVIRKMQHDPYLLLSWKTLLIIPASAVSSVVLHGVVYGLFYEGFERAGHDEWVFFFAVPVLPLFFIVAFVYTVIRKVLRNRTT